MAVFRGPSPKRADPPPLPNLPVGYLDLLVGRGGRRDLGRVERAAGKIQAVDEPLGLSILESLEIVRNPDGVELCLLVAPLGAAREVTTATSASASASPTAARLRGSARALAPARVSVFGVTTQ